MSNNPDGRYGKFDFNIPDGWEVVSRKNGITRIRRVKNKK
jgi:hypothetical protein